MKKLVISLVFGCLLGTSQAWAHGDHLKPQFGGTTAEADVFQIEVVVKGSQVTIYLSEHGSPVETAGATGKLLVLTGKTKEEFVLTPNGYQTMGAQLKNRPAKGAKAVATITAKGYGIGTARFTFK